MLKPNIFHDLFKSPIGEIHILSVKNRLISLTFSKNEIFEIKRKYFNGFQEISGNNINKITSKSLERYFKGKLKNFNIPLMLLGTDFQKKVWFELLKIPYGEVITYKELAKRAGLNYGYQAVGQANSKNPIGIIIPCHRVIASGSKLGGYSGGLDKKRFLLELENVFIE